jgi:putative transcriptional regulator
MRRKGSLSPKGAKIVDALSRFRDALKNGVPIAANYTVRTVELVLRPRVLTPDDVKQVRSLLGLSQTLFAHFLGVDVKTVRSWEQGLREPSPMACRFMDEISESPDFWRERLRRAIVAKNQQTVES